MAQPAELIPARLTDEPEWAAELADNLAEGWIESPIPKRAEPWEITGTATAEWAMRKLAELIGRAREIALQAVAWRAPIDDWERAERGRIQPGIEFFEGHLERWGIAQRFETGEATVRLPSGKVSTTLRKEPAVDVVDEAALIAWADDNLPAEEQLAVVKTEQRVLVSELRPLVELLEVRRPFCQACGAAIIEDSDGALTSGSAAAWLHVDAEAEQDHDAVPVVEHQVVLAGTDVVVDGVGITWPEVSVKVKPGQ